MNTRDPNNTTQCNTTHHADMSNARALTFPSPPSRPLFSSSSAGTLMGSQNSSQRSGSFDPDGLPRFPYRDSDGRVSDDSKVDAAEHTRIAELNSAVRALNSEWPRINRAGWPFDQFWFGAYRSEHPTYDRPAKVDWVCCAELWPDDPRWKSLDKEAKEASAAAAAAAATAAAAKPATETKTENKTAAPKAKGTDKKDSATAATANPLRIRRCFQANHPRQARCCRCGTDKPWPFPRKCCGCLQQEVA
jgi:hypothetical protein